MGPQLTSDHTNRMQLTSFNSLIRIELEIFVLGLCRTLREIMRALKEDLNEKLFNWLLCCMIQHAFITIVSSTSNNAQREGHFVQIHIMPLQVYRKKIQPYSCSHSGFHLEI